MAGRRKTETKGEGVEDEWAVKRERERGVNGEWNGENGGLVIRNGWTSRVLDIKKKTMLDQVDRLLCDQIELVTDRLSMRQSEPVWPLPLSLASLPPLRCLAFTLCVLCFLCFLCFLLFLS